MTLLFMDGFDVGDTTLKWTSMSPGIESGATTTTRFGYGKSWHTHVWGATLTKRFTASAQVSAGSALLATGGMSGQTLFTVHTDTGATTHLTVKVNADSTISLLRGASVIATSTQTWNWVNAWHYVELLATIDSATGRGVVAVDNVTVIDFTGNTRNGGTSTNIDQLIFYVPAPGSGDYGYIDDAYICNGLGSANNGLLGDVRVQTLQPNAPGASTQLTPTGAATGWQANSDGVDTTYAASATVGQRDTYAMGDLLVGTGAVLAVQDVIHASKSDAGVGQIKAALKSGASVYYDPTQSLGTSVSAYLNVREVDPATSAAWSASGVNAVEFGAEVA